MDNTRPKHRIFLLGDGNIGKSSLLEYFQFDRLRDLPHGMGIEIVKFDFNYQVKPFEVLAYDLNDVEKYMRQLWKYTDSVLLIFDTTNRQSFDNIKQWMHLTEINMAENIPKILIGTKIDLAEQRQVSQEEINELRSDRKSQSATMEKLEKFVIENLASEITEFHKDKKDVVETKVRLVSEAKDQLDTLKKKFVEKSSKLVKEAVTGTLRDELTQLKEDIKQARENNFGRKLFETFAAEYSTSYLNENQEMKDLEAVIVDKDKQLKEAYYLMCPKVKKSAEAKEIVESQLGSE